MIKLEKTTKTNLKAKGLQFQNGQVVEIETGEIIDLTNIILNAFGENNEFDFTVTTSTKEESEVDTGEPAEFDPDADEYWLKYMD